MTDLTLKAIMREAYTTAEEHGFHRRVFNFGEKIALMHSELSEALEAHRAGGSNDDWDHVTEELADTIIRICDTAQELNLNLEQAIKDKMARNRNRPYMHGGKRF